MSVSWSDHLSFGEGDGRLDTPQKVARAMRRWRDELGAAALHWRLLRTRIPGRFFAAPGYLHPTLIASRSIDWDDFALVPELAHQAGLRAWLYVSVFDEGWPLAADADREVSYHNAMHGRHVAWQSDLTRDHPEWLTVDRAGRRQPGVVSLAHPEARRAFIDRWMRLLAPTDFDGLFVCLRSQSRPADAGDQFGFDERIRADFFASHGVDIQSGPGTRDSGLGTRDSGLGARDSKIQGWRDLQGEYLTALLAELRAELTRGNRQLGIGVARGDVIGPPLGNATLQWREWARQGLVDQLVIDQNSSQCPSMWHQLWPMHRGAGYVQNYLDGSGMPPLAEHLAIEYGPAIAGTRTQLFVARQWTGRDAAAERELRGTPGVTGLVFSSFRHDNPAAIAKGDWTAGRLTPR